MGNSGVALILSFMVLSNLAYATLAECPACAGETSNWTSSAIDFLQGKVANDAPSGLSAPQQARLIDAQIDAKKSSQASNAASNTAATSTYNSTSELNIVLNNISAEPNPSSLGDPVKITAVFGNSSNAATANDISKTTNLAGMMVYADIKNAVGIMVARLNLKQMSWNEYAGTWYANLGSGTFIANIDASGPQGSKTFTEALRMVVNESKSITGDVRAVRKLG